MKIILTVFLLVSLVSWANSQDQEFFKLKLSEAEKQLSLLLEDAENADRIPRTIAKDGYIHWTMSKFDWTEGFFPGICWYMFEYSGNTKWETAAKYFQKKFIGHRFLTTYHDLGFAFNCSFGNGYRLNGDKKSKQVLIDAANSLIQRYNKTVGCIQSWDTDKGWQAERGWKFPVIIDNMMNLELLFKAAIITGDDRYEEIAVSHADKTLNNHFRKDMSSYHVVDYDPETGRVRNKHTAQGFAHESIWARGQAWGLYGYVICYRYTKNPVYLNQAKKIADFIINSPEIPSDKIPYWDFNAGNIPNEPRDASAAAITASALIELSDYSENNYLDYAKEIIYSLSSKEYFAEEGTNNHFILKHSVGSIPHNNEIDVPLNYADYYYVEALLKLMKKYKN